MAAAVDSLGQPTNPYQYPVYATPLQPHADARVLSTPATGPPQTWQTSNGIAPPQAHMQPAPHLLTRSVDPSWDNAYSHTPTSANPLVGPSEAPAYDYRYARDDQSDQWVGGAEYYDPAVRAPSLT